jgi:hypothetical protein
MADHLNPGVGRRTPLSGGNSGHDTTGDGLDLNGLYLEAKYRAKHTVCTLHRDTREKALRENRLAVSALKEKNQRGWLYVIDSRDLDEFVRIIAENRDLAPEIANKHLGVEIQTPGG